MARPDKQNQAQDDFLEKLVAVNRTAKVVKGGRQFGFTALTVVGDGAGRVGFGFGKAREVPVAISKAMAQARKNMVPVALKNDTLHFAMHGTHGATKVYMQPASDGTGVIAGGGMRAVLECAGVRNVLAKSYGSRNPINVVRATVNALAAAKSPEDIAAKRGKSVEEILGYSPRRYANGEQADHDHPGQEPRRPAEEHPVVGAWPRPAPPPPDGAGCRHAAEPRNDLRGQAPADGRGPR
jgi:small subunit ribosomal protein S5